MPICIITFYFPIKFKSVANRKKSLILAWHVASHLKFTCKSWVVYYIAE